MYSPCRAHIPKAAVSMSISEFGAEAAVYDSEWCDDERAHHAPFAKHNVRTNSTGRRRRLVSSKENVLKDIVQLSLCRAKCDSDDEERMYSHANLPQPQAPYPITLEDVILYEQALKREAILQQQEAEERAAKLAAKQATKQQAKQTRRENPKTLDDSECYADDFDSVEEEDQVTDYDVMPSKYMYV